MKILLIGEYSNVHATLAKGLRWMGHEATVLSNGDFWKNYPRDIDLSRRTGKIGGLAYFTHLYTLLPRLKGYDVVQLINPMFLELKAVLLHVTIPSMRDTTTSRTDIFPMRKAIAIQCPVAYAGKRAGCICRRKKQCRP